MVGKVDQSHWPDIYFTLCYEGNDSGIVTHLDLENSKTNSIGQHTTAVSQPTNLTSLTKVKESSSIDPFILHGYAGDLMAKCLGNHSSGHNLDRGR